MGLEPGQFIGAAISHLHVDHSGGIRTLAEAGVPIYIQREKRFFTLVGQDAEKTVLTYYLNANLPGADGRPIEAASCA